MPWYMRIMMTVQQVLKVIAISITICLHMTLHDNNSVFSLCREVSILAQY